MTPGSTATIFRSPEEAGSSSAGPASLPGGARYKQFFISDAGATWGQVDVTPEIARSWLTHNNIGNRPQKAAPKDRFARDMARGEWYENGDTIRFAADGRLIDGQHRLESLIMAGLTLTLVVVTNLTLKAQPTIDAGTLRRMVDLLTFAEKESPRQTAPVLRRIVMWEKGFQTPSTTYQPSASEQFDFLEANPEVLHAVRAAIKYGKRNLLPTQAVGLCWWVFSKIDPAACEDFFERLASGIDSGGKHPIWELREKLHSENTGSTSPKPRFLLGLTFKAWNHYRAGKTNVILRFAETEKLPVPE